MYLTVKFKLQELIKKSTNRELLKAAHFDQNRRVERKLIYHFLSSDHLSHSSDVVKTKSKVKLLAVGKDSRVNLSFQLFSS